MGEEERRRHWIVQNERASAMYKRIGRLSKLQKIILGKFLLGGTLDEIASEHGIGRERVLIIERSALAELFGEVSDE